MKIDDNEVSEISRSCIFAEHFTLRSFHSANRHAEFGRAAIERLLAKRKPVAKYFGMFRKEQTDAAQALGNAIYTHWAGSSEAPARQRPPTPSRVEPSLHVLAFRNGSVVFSESLMQKFPVGSPQYVELVKLKEAIKTEIEIDTGDSAAPATQRTPERPRASGRPDWSIEGGLRPLDLEKVITLENVPTASLDLSRLGILVCVQICFASSPVPIHI